MDIVNKLTLAPETIQKKHVKYDWQTYKINLLNPGKKVSVLMIEDGVVNYDYSRSDNSKPKKSKY